MKVWLFDEVQLEAALAAHFRMGDHGHVEQGMGIEPLGPQADIVRAFLNSRAAVDQKLHMEIRPKVNVPVTDADIAEARRSSQTEEERN